MLDEAIAGEFRAQSWDESMLSKIEAKTARFLTMAQLRREQVESEQERVRALISDISHQTKTPLANIALYTQLLQEQDLTGEQAHLTAQIAESSEKLNFLIQSLVTVSRLESGIIKVIPVPGDACELARSALSSLAGKAADKDIPLTAALPEAPVIAAFDPRWCAEALVNVIDNAVKYTGRGGSVTVSVAEYEMFARVDVADTGRGIREDDLPKVFTRFWRAEESADSPGVGIGLYLAREIVTACGGFIRVQSRYGKGSTFSVFLSKNPAKEDNP